MENQQLAGQLEYIADLLELDEANPFKVRSYREAARSVRQHDLPLKQMMAEGKSLSELPRIGDSISEDIQQLIEDRSCQRLDELKQRQPVSLPELMQIRQLGPKMARRLHEELGVENVADLKDAIEAHKVRDLPGFGEKTEQRLRKGVEDLAESAGRFLRDQATRSARALGDHLDSIPAIERHEIAGSMRRCKETVGDLDVLIQADKRNDVLDAIMHYDEVEARISHGEEKASVRLSGGMRVDIRFVEQDNFGAALLYFTGSKEHSVQLRKRARERNWKLSEYGLFKGDHCLAAKTEEAVYQRLNLAWIPPELRENRGEIEAAENDELPNLVEWSDIRGDLHCHTRETDGKHGLARMLDAAEECGYDYVAITDHSQNMQLVDGMNEDRARRHAERIRKAGARRDIHVLAGVEVDILQDGTLDLDEEVLQDLDWVVASIHSRLELDEAAMTRRLVKAVESGVVHCIGHPLCRHIGHRGPIDIHFSEFLEACAEHDVFLEINADPDRLDLPDTFCRQAREAGVRMVISTDAHQAGGFRNLRYGVEVARRGWLSPSDVVNTLSWKDFKAALGK